ncbi:MAG: hypothetical protein AAF703_00730 [Cyanobacteria bacterium P01_D01_bin.105]
MVKASGQIEQELRALQDQTEMMSAALEPLYEGYLKALSDAGQRQLVMAAYYLCTQAYPDRFLALSWDDRNRLQQSLQALASHIWDQLSQQSEQAKKMSRQRQSSDGLAFLQRLLESRMANGEGRHRRGGERVTNDEPSVNEAERRSRRQNRSTAELFGEVSSNEEDFIPGAEEDLEDSDLSFSSLEDSALEDSVFEDNALEDGALDIDALARNDATDNELNQLDDVEESIDFENSDSGAIEDDQQAFEMEVPAADERLSIDEEEDLLAALEGLARRSMEMREERSGSSATSDGETLADESNDEEERPLTPIHLVRQKMLLEKAIREVFKAVSEEANELLQKANVMPNFPRSLMTAATESGGLGEPANVVPNVVRVSVRVMHGEALREDNEEEISDEDRSANRSKRSNPELGEDDWTQGGSEPASDGRSGKEQSPRNQSSRSRASRGAESSRRRLRRHRDHTAHHDRSERGARSGRSRRAPRIMPHEIIEIESLPELAAISLRLSEVEFTDPTVSAWRSRLRQKLAELKKLGVRYKKTQRSLETAQAEDAWRSSWTVRSSDADD